MEAVELPGVLPRVVQVLDRGCALLGTAPLPVASPHRPLEGLTIRIAAYKMHTGYESGCARLLCARSCTLVVLRLFARCMDKKRCVRVTLHM